MRGCAGVTEQTGASCQRNDKTDTGKFSECGKAQRGDKNVRKGFVSGVWRHETPHKLLYWGGNAEMGRGMRRLGEIYVAGNEKMEIKIYRRSWLSTKEGYLTRK